MSINKLIAKQVKKQVITLLGMTSSEHPPVTLNCMVGKKVIIRTYSAGVWFGILDQKSGNEVILKNARRMWHWWAAKSISLSGVVNYGVKPDKSHIAPSVEHVWLEAIEIIPCNKISIDSIEGCKNAEAK